jgi:hypothetical protein
MSFIYITTLFKIEMEKEIYLTESPYYSELNETNPFAKDKKLDSMKHLRP